ncbi:sigma-70 family RNA polymerase sigma factor [Telmatocola sphagniphila]|uniref:Sigma-70 family RNA polymerase sigma factor n=1 Tax=Telmatocola sphagniphila TaxID=1123043 RepID=A0A8E6B8R4_9BACT|nr:sigma-70 family RNA polymerase sigma factor [Telmatocola sphagniphila]QVL33957.1 sigma-70 family RNA polymerase sigma factor [Telmatocola sphagniphila]
MSETSISQRIQPLLERLRLGEASARNELISISYDRFRNLTAKILRVNFSRLKEWEQTDDVVQEAAVRLWKSLEAVQPTSTREYLGLGAAQIRRQLLDLTRHYYGRRKPGEPVSETPGRSPGPMGDPVGIDVSGNTWDPHRLAQWTEFHELVEKLPEEEREVVDLLIYHELTQEEAAEIIGVDKSTVKRRWRAARLKIAEAL